MSIDFESCRFSSISRSANLYFFNMSNYWVHGQEIPSTQRGQRSGSQNANLVGSYVLCRSGIGLCIFRLFYMAPTSLSYDGWPVLCGDLSLRVPQPFTFFVKGAGLEPITKLPKWGERLSSKRSFTR